MLEKVVISVTARQIFTLLPVIQSLVFQRNAVHNVCLCLDWLQGQPDHLQLLHHGKLLLVAGGRSVPTYPTDGHLL